MGVVVSPWTQDDALMMMIVISVLSGLGLLSAVSVTRMIAGRRFDRQLRFAAGPEEGVARIASPLHLSESETRLGRLPRLSRGSRRLGVG